MALIRVVNKYKHLPTEVDVYIGRGSVLGNPFTHQDMSKTLVQYQCSTREESIAKYREHLVEMLKTGKDKAYRLAIRDILDRLKAGHDVNLVCFCKPKSCHGDVIKEIVEKLLLQ